MEEMSERAKILEEATQVVCHDRADQYGSVEDNFGIIAKLWSSYFGFDVSAVDVSCCMILLKIAREKSNDKRDNWIDIAGYAACGAEVSAAKVEQSSVISIPFWEAPHIEIVRYIWLGIERDRPDTTWLPRELTDAVAERKIIVHDAENELVIRNDYGFDVTVHVGDAIYFDENGMVGVDGDDGEIRWISYGGLNKH